MDPISAHYEKERIEAKTDGFYRGLFVGIVFGILVLRIIQHLSGMLPIHLTFR